MQFGMTLFLYKTNLSRWKSNVINTLKCSETESELAPQPTTVKFINLKLAAFHIFEIPEAWFRLPLAANIVHIQTTVVMNEQ